MVKNLLTRIVVSVFLSASTILSPGCAYELKPTTYGEKCDAVENGLRENELTGNYDVGAIVPSWKITRKNN